MVRLNVPELKIGECAFELNRGYVFHSFECLTLKTFGMFVRICKWRWNGFIHLHTQRMNIHLNTLKSNVTSDLLSFQRTNEILKRRRPRWEKRRRRRRLILPLCDLAPFKFLLPHISFFRRS